MMVEARGRRLPTKSVDHVKQTISDSVGPSIAVGVSVRTFILLIIAHAYLGVFISGNAVYATLHAILIGSTALYFVLRDKSPERTYLMMGYIVGCEILWRMSRADIFWMYAEYLVIILSVFSVARFHQSRKGIGATVVYTGLLLISVPMALALPIEVVRKGLAFNLAGPVAFGVSVYSASRVSVNEKWLPPIAFTAILPVLSVAVLATLGVVAGGIVFGASSSYDASGGYAPNQVSTLMSYASVILFALINMQNSWSRFRVPFIVMMVYLSAQGVLTFSRGGLLNTIAYLMLFLPYLLRDGKTRLRLIGLAIIMIPLLVFVVWPKIEHLTGAALEQRYSTSGTTTGRSRIIEEELNVFAESPILGVGPGMSTYIRSQTYGTFRAATHTEYTRLLAEHGIVGVIAFLFFLGTYRSLYVRSRFPRTQGMVLATLGWTLTMFIHAATRTLTFGFLTVLTVLWVQSYSDDTVNGQSQQDTTS